MMKIPQTGTFIELDPVIGWQATIKHLSPVIPTDLAARCTAGQPVPSVSAPGIALDCVTGQPPAPAGVAATGCCMTEPAGVKPASPLFPTGLAVDCVTGQPVAFVSSLAGQLHYPVAVARGDCDRKLYVLDGAVNRVKVLDVAAMREFITVAGFGGKGKQARRFRKPRGLAMLPDGSYVIADTGNHQVKIFSRFPNALLERWGSGNPGSALGEFSSPWKVVADGCGLISIADRGNGRIQRIRRGGSFETPIAGLKDPTGLALAPDGTLAVLDSPNVYIYAPGQTTASQTLQVEAGSCLTLDDNGCYLYVGTSTALVYKFEAAAGVGFRSVGIGVTGVQGQFLDLLWTPGEQLIGILLTHCAPPPALVTIATCGSYSACGTLTTVTLDSEIENCVWDRIQLNASVPPGTVIEVATQTAKSDEWPVPFALGCPVGITSMSRLASGLVSAQITDVSNLAPGMQVAVNGASDSSFNDQVTILSVSQNQVPSSTTPLAGAAAWQTTTLSAGTATGGYLSGIAANCALNPAPLSLTGENPDCLVQSLPGRYLRVQLQLKTNGIDSPLLRSIQISYPRSSYLQYLPAVYQQDDQSRVFLDRFLRIFQTTFDGLDRTLDDMWKRFDPLSVPDSWFAWLAAWIALPINPLWTDQERRTALRSAGALYRKRGTPSAVQQLVKQYANVAVRLIEHYRLRQLIILPDKPDAGTALGSGTRLWSRDYYQRLQLGVYSHVGYFELTGEPEPDVEPLAWGANEFTVFFDCEPYEVLTTRQSVSQVVEREKPAYTKANYAPVFPRMRVGVQSTLGVDTRIGEFTPLLLGTTGTLDYDSILSCSRTETHLSAQHATLQPQVEMNTRLL